jgi:hypothetical protein
VTVEAGGVSLRLVGDAAAGRPKGRDGPEYEGHRPVEMPMHWLFFSSREKGIVSACHADGWMTAEQISAALGESPTTELRAVLRNLVERQVLESATSRGYRLKLTGGGAKADAEPAEKGGPQNLGPPA